MSQRREGNSPFPLEKGSRGSIPAATPVLRFTYLPFITKRSQQVKSLNGSIVRSGQEILQQDPEKNPAKTRNTNTKKAKGAKMFKKFAFAVLLVMLLSVFAVPVAFAADEPAGSCPTGFTPEMVMDHGDHHHMHVGTDVDLNGDGWICMKPVTPTEKVHVHVDNNLP